MSFAEKTYHFAEKTYHVENNSWYGDCLRAAAMPGIARGAANR
jgi:hypothetical protein